MSLTLSGSGTIGGLVAGGLPDATVTAADLASGAARTNFGAGAVLQVVNSVVNTTLSGSIGGGTNPAYNSGTSYMTINFTPTSSSSKILVQSSSLSFSEASNSVDAFWMAAFYDTTRIGIVSGTANAGSFLSGLNAAYHVINFMTPSWGTEQKTIDIRIGTNAPSNSVYVNFNPNVAMDSSARNFAVTIWEIAG